MLSNALVHGEMRDRGDAGEMRDGRCGADETTPHKQERTAQMGVISSVPHHLHGETASGNRTAPGWATSSSRCCGLSPYVARLRWEAIWMPARVATIKPFPITPVATATVPSAKLRHASAGWHGANKICSACPTSTSSLPYPTS